jgi:hypothetical protein
MISRSTFEENAKKIVSTYIAEPNDEFSEFDQILLLNSKEYDNDFSAIVENLVGDTRKFEVLYNENDKQYLLGVYTQTDVKGYKEEDL